METNPCYVCATESRLPAAPRGRARNAWGCNEDLPIAGICVLERIEQAHTEPVSFTDVMDVLIRQTHRPRDVDGLVRCLESIEEIGSDTPLWRMGCTLDEHCARMSYEAMARTVRN